MKSNLLRPTLRSGLLVALLAVGQGGCGGGGFGDGGGGGGGGGGEPVCGFVPGQVTTNIGSSIGNNYSFGPFCGYAIVVFNNINGTFSESILGDYDTHIVDLGDVCLEDATYWPGGGTNYGVAVFLGHTYVAEFVKRKGQDIGKTCYARFRPQAYSNGVLTLTYVANL